MLFEFSRPFPQQLVQWKWSTQHQSCQKSSSLTSSLPQNITPIMDYRIETRTKVCLVCGYQAKRTISLGSSSEILVPTFVIKWLCRMVFCETVLVETGPDPSWHAARPFGKCSTDTGCLACDKDNLHHIDSFRIELCISSVRELAANGDCDLFVHLRLEHK